MEIDDSDASSDASVLEQEPISGAVLLDQELLHRETCAARGSNILTGCPKLDEDVLVGGLARGRVVGLSAEEEGFGLLFGLQIIAQLLVTAAGEDGGAGRPSAMIITTLSHAELLPTLRRVVKGQAATLPGGGGEGVARMRAALEGISISRVFDFDGLREALDELDLPVEMGDQAQELPTEEPGDSGVEKEPKPSRESHKEPEIRDSEEEEDGAFSPGSSSPTKRALQPQRPPPALQTIQPYKQHYPTPDIVLITNLTSLITSLYATHERKHAHRMLRDMSSRLRYLSRSSSHGGPLFLLLNSTTSKSGTTEKPIVPHPPQPGEDQQLQQQQQQQDPDDQQPPSSVPSTPFTGSSISSSPPHSPSDQIPLPDNEQDLAQAQALAQQQRKREKDSDLSLIRSVFNPAPPDPAEEAGEEDEYGYARHPNPDFEFVTRLSKRNKPFFGLRFDEMVDVHLLASRVPRTEEDADVWFEGLRGEAEEGEEESGLAAGVEAVWVVEVLGDRAGVWVEDEEEEEWESDYGAGKGEGEGKDREENMGVRFNREQRWTGVEVLEEGGWVRIAEALVRRSEED